MEFTNIVPNGPYGLPLNNKQFINFLLRTINFAYNIRGSENNFPGPQPVSIEKKDFEKLATFDYNITLKLDGTRFLLYFMLDKHQNKQIILINRALNFFKINIECEDNLFDSNGTLLDGELIYHDFQWKFYVHDGLILCGNKINKESHRERIDNIKCCLESFVYNKNVNTFKIETKTFYNFNEIDHFIDNIYNNNSFPSNDGLIFMPNKLPVVSGTQYSMFKWKLPNKHTFDFKIIENESNLIAKVYHLNKLIDFANIKADDINGKQFIDTLKQLDNYQDECIVECNFDKEKQNFIPILIRTDKTHPNSLRTIERTLFNINENIIIDDFKNI